MKILQVKGFDIFWQKEWRSYDIIEQEIAGSDCLLALVDSNWSCSTWMASEVTWAMGMAGVGFTDNEIIKPIPVFIYPIDNSWQKTFLRDFPVILLDKNVETAVKTICKKMANFNSTCV